MSDVILGKLITGEAHRDAIHIAVAPMVAGERLWPGQDIKLKYGTSDVALRASGRDYGPDMAGIGIVDPFLEGEVNEGERFWGFLSPNSVTGMRHHWQHPAFDSQPVPSNESEAWLRAFCDKYSMRFNEVIRQAQDKEGWATAIGQDLHGEGELEPGEPQNFWYHMSVYTGKTFDQNHRDNFGWSCSC